MPLKQQRAVQKYLSTYAEALCELDIHNLEINKRHALVIPAYNETPEFVVRLANHKHAHDTLLILVLNEPTGAEDDTHNPLLYQWCLSHTRIDQRSNTYLYGKFNALQYLLLDHTGEHALPAKQGVGLARKIGADLAARLIQAQKIQSPWIYSSDADSHLPCDYFCAQQGGLSGTAAFVYNFEHIGEPGVILDATRIYQDQIRYYRQQLQDAGSPYAFFTLGSCIAISMPHYCQVRGFPKKAAGEDFYLLNKLAKLGKIHFLEAHIVEIEARLSDRVPFGTGPAVQKIVQQLKNNDAITYYNPKIFAALQELLNQVEQLWLNHEQAITALSPPLRKAMEQAGLNDFLAKRRVQDKTLAQFRSSFHAWFDAFQVLKLVHRLQEDSNYSPVRFPLPNSSHSAIIGSTNKERK